MIVTAAAAGAASAGAGFLVGVPVLIRLLVPAQNPQNPSLSFVITYSAAVGAIWIVPAAAGALAGALTAPFFIATPAGDE